MVRNSLETTSSRQVEHAEQSLGYQLAWPLAPSSIEGQITEWKTMLSLP